MNGGTVAGPGGFEGRPPGDVRALVRQQLMALLEQLGPQVMGPGEEKQQQGQGQDCREQGEKEQQQGTPVWQELAPLQAGAAS